MADINKVFLSGVMGKDIDVKTVGSAGNQVGSFSMATKKSFKKKGSTEWEEKTEWHNIVVWGSLSEYVANYGGKGSQITVEGELTTESYDDKDGKKVYVTKIKADVISLPMKRKEGGSSQQSATSSTSRRAEDDDLPF